MNQFRLAGQFEFSKIDLQQPIDDAQRREGYAGEGGLMARSDARNSKWNDSHNLAPPLLRLLWLLSWQDKKVTPHAVEQTESLDAVSILSPRSFAALLNDKYKMQASAINRNLKYNMNKSNG